MRAPNSGLLVALGVVLVLYVLSRTQAGQSAVASATESIMSTVRGLRNNNPGNLRANAFLGSIGVDADGYAQFDTLQNGVRAAARQLKLYMQRGTNSVGAIISMWAPSSENDTGAYIGAVSDAIGVDSRDRLSNDEDTLAALLRAIFNHELGSIPAAVISDEMIRAGIESA